MPASEYLYSSLPNLIDFQMLIKWLSSQSKIPYTEYKQTESLTCSCWTGRT